MPDSSQPPQDESEPIIMEREESVRDAFMRLARIFIAQRVPYAQVQRALLSTASAVDQCPPPDVTRH